MFFLTEFRNGVTNVLDIAVLGKPSGEYLNPFSASQTQRQNRLILQGKTFTDAAFDAQSAGSNAPRPKTLT